MHDAEDDGLQGAHAGGDDSDRRSNGAFDPMSLRRRLFFDLLAGLVVAVLAKGVVYRQAANAAGGLLRGPHLPAALPSALIGIATVARRMAAHGLVRVRWLRRHGAALLAVLSTLFFGYLAIRDVDPGTAWRALERAQLLWLAPSAAALAVAIYLRAWRWQAMFEPRSRPPLDMVLSALLLGYLFNNLLPMRAGEAVRIEALRQEAGTPRAETLATVVIERLFDVLSLLVLLFSAVLWLPSFTWLRQAAVLALVAVVGLVAVVLALARYGDRAVRPLIRPLRILPAFRTARLEHAVQNITRGCATVRDPGMSARVFAITTVSWITMAFSFWLLSFGFDLQLPPGAGLLVVITVNLTLILPSSPAGLGLFEAATVVALHAYAVNQSDALSYALVLHALNFVPFVAVGAFILARRPAIRSLVRPGRGEATISAPAGSRRQ